MLNKKIKLLRTNRGLSQVELAKHLGVTKQSVSNWENDNILPSIELLIKIAKFFSVSTDYLLDLSTEDKIDTDGLTSAEIAHIKMLIDDLRKRKA